MFYSTHLKIGFGKNPKTILPLPTGRRASITATKIWFFEKPETKPVLVYHIAFKTTCEINSIFSAVREGLFGKNNPQ